VIVLHYNRKYSPYKSIKVTKELIEYKFSVLAMVMIVLFSFITIALYNLQILNQKQHSKRAVALGELIVEGTSVPRGRIYDRNYNLIVDNMPVKTIIYQKERGITKKEEIKLAYQVAELIDIDAGKLTDRNLREFWLINNNKGAQGKITPAERRLFKERKLTLSEMENLQLERITTDELNEYNDFDKKVAYLYFLMNQGYYYDEKVIKNETVTDQEYALISERVHILRGFKPKLDWERKYLYNNIFRLILGNVSTEKQGIPAELKDYYLNQGYQLNDRVGISYLEYQYEHFLKGVKPQYQLLKNNNYQLISAGERGKDIVLTIDIKLQQALEEILTEEILKTKREPNTAYYNRSLVVIINPKTGEILAMSGKQALPDNKGEYRIIDYTPGIMTSPVTVGSVIKGASMMVGYQQGVIDIGTRMLDECIKIKDTPRKCSWRTLGWVNDIEALKWSSNVYQFKIAMGVGKGQYAYNYPLKIDPEAFSIYRRTYHEFGLGVKTGIDLPIESIGYVGNSTLPGHLLNFAMGQYDTYTPIQLAQYISTLANNGYRLQPYLLKAVYQSSNNEHLKTALYQAHPQILNKVKVEDKYIKRVQEGLQAVMGGILGRGYMGNAPKPAGKTGTAESFFDSDGDGIIDKETITTTFAGYAPSDNPEMAIVVVSPDVRQLDTRSSYQSNVNRRIAIRVVNKFFALYQ
jgi:cell division protein FtsI/penicillin-binding protein 2